MVDSIRSGEGRQSRGRPGHKIGVQALVMADVPVSNLVRVSKELADE